MAAVLTAPATGAQTIVTRTDIALTGVYEISKLLSAAVRLEHKLAGVLSLLSSYLDMRHGLIALLHADGSPEAVVGAGWSEAVAKRYFDLLPDRAIGQIVVTQMPLVVTDVGRDPLFAGWRQPDAPADGMTVSFIGVPIKEGDQVVGTLTIDRYWDGQAEFRLDEDARFLTMIANLIGQTIQLHGIVARDRERLLAEQRRLQKALSESRAVEEPNPVPGIVGDSPMIRAVLDKIRIVARSHTTVLLRGESGTGKELFARAIHDLSPRRSGPFIKLNCAALPESVLESELFGHEKGAFTGAHAQHKGRFELADGGTLFLDEIGEISPSFQAKLLRVLQEGEFERVGGSRTLKVDVRLVTATNRNLEDGVSKGTFRSDLYYRIAVVQVLLPPLRERAGDIPLLAREFLRRFNKENGTSLQFETSALTVLADCHFPGNVRELENCVRRTATFARGVRLIGNDFACRNDVCLSAVLWKAPSRAPVPDGFVPLPIAGESLPPQVLPAPANSAAAPPACPDPEAAQRCGHACPPGTPSERDRLVEAMETAGWVQAKAARILGLTARQMGYALRKHNVPIKKF